LSAKLENCRQIQQSRRIRRIGGSSVYHLLRKLFDIHAAIGGAWQA